MSKTLVRKFCSLGLAVALAAVQIPLFASSAVAVDYAFKVSERPTRARAVPMEDGLQVRGEIFAFVGPQSAIDRVEFSIDGVLVRTDTSAPFDLAGSRGGKALPFPTSVLDDGPHLFAIEAQGSSGTQVVTALLEVDNSMPLRVSQEPDRDPSAPLEGQTLVGPAYILAESPEGFGRPNIQAVRFWIDDPDQSGPFYTNDKQAPYDFAGSTAGSANPLDTATLDDGDHLITARVKYKRNGGEFRYFESSFSTANTTGPAAPTNLIATAGDGVVDLDWDDNTDDATNYDVYRSVTSPVAIENANRIGDGELVSEFSDTTAVNGTTYYYVVTARDADDNESDPSNEATATPGDTDAPAAPAITLTRIGDDITLDWADVADAASYEVFRSFTAPVDTNGVPLDTVTDSTFADLDLVLDGSTVSYRVVAIDEADNRSADSNQVSEVLPDEVGPAAPTNLIATAGDGVVDLDWDDNTDATNYDVYRSVTSPVAIENANRIGDGELVSEFSDTTAVNGTTYYYVVTARDADDNESDPSNEATATPGDTDAPAAPAITLTRIGDDITLDWADVADAASYEVFRSFTAPVDTNGVPLDTVTDSTFADLDLVLDGSTVSYRVVAIDEADNRSADSNQVSEVLPDEVGPAAPTNLIATAGDGVVDLDWDDNTDATNYDVYRSVTSPVAIENANRIGDGELVSEFSDTTAVNGTTYYYVVTARDADDNESDPSNEATATPGDTDAPAAPAITLTRIGDDITLDWADVADAASYEVFRSFTAPVDTNGVPLDTVTDSTFADLDLVLDGSTVSYRVVAIDEADNRSADSNQVSEVLPDEVGPAAPTNLIATAGDGVVDLDWDDNTDATNYDVYRSVTSPVAIENANRIGDGELVSEFSDTTAVNGTTYYYVVTARDADDNESDPSNEATATPEDIDAPAAPTNLVANGLDDEVSLTWDNHPEAGVTFNVYRALTAATIDTSTDTPIASGLTTPDHTDSDVTNGTTYYYVVTAVDAATNESAPSNEDSATPTASDCEPYSPLPCAQVPVTLPYDLTFDGTEGGLLDDAAGGALGTGFTMIQPSGSVLGPYLPENLNVSGGALTIKATHGIQYRVPDASPGENLLDNGLGVGLDPDGLVRIETTVINPPSPSSQAQQAGLWFGPDQDNYVKLVVGTQASGAVRVQLAFEQGGGANGNPAVAPPELNGGAFSPTGATIRLILLANPATGVVTGSYTVNGGAPVSLPAPSSFTVPASFFDNATISSAIPGATTTAGIFTSRRNSTQMTAESFTFGEFSVEAVDTTAPAAPANLVATAGEGQIALDWDDNTDDATNYDVYRSTSPGVAITDANRIGDGVSLSEFTDTEVTDGIAYHYVVTARDAADNESDPSNEATATPNGAVADVDLKVNFQSETAPVPAGYLRDFGQAFGPRTSADQGTGLDYGWLTQGTTDPLSLVGNGRDRNAAGVTDQRVDTLMHMLAADIPGAFTGVKARGDWQVALPDGTYAVTVSAGDPSVGADPETHTINVEGTNAISGFVPTGLAGASTRWTSGSVQVEVTDGHLTIDAIGGVNTKIQFVDIASVDTTGPAAPTNLIATAGDGVVDLDWDDNTDDATNYDVYRSVTSPVAIENANRIGDGELVSEFSDTTAVNGTTYYYVVTARDADDNESDPSNEATATPGDTTPCDPYSPLPCAQVSVTLPYDLTFNGTEGGLLDDLAGGALGTGFTMIQPSGSVLGPYLPENLSVSGGTLTIRTTQGIQYRVPGQAGGTVNNLDNGLGVGIDAGAATLQIETTLVAPPAGTNSAEQAGLWFGPDQDNYVKLVVASQASGNVRVQLLSEVGGGADGVVTTAPLELNTAAFNLGSSTIRLILVANPVTGSVTGSYEIDGGAPQSLPAPSSFTVPVSFFSNATISSAIPGATTTAGIFTTQRNNTGTPLDYSFGEFSVSQVGEDDTIPPLAPTGLAAIPGDGQVTLDWDDNAEADLAGYDIYRSTTTPVDTTGQPLNGETIVAASQYVDDTVTNGVEYFYTVKAIDIAGNPSDASLEASATPQVGAQPPFDVQVNFQNAAAAVPSGYVRDFGEAYGARSGADQGTGLTYGWVEPGTTTPRDLSVGGTTPGNGRDRNINPDQRYDTLMHMQADDVVASTFNGTALPGSWEIAVPNGMYDVTVAAGDATAGNALDVESHTINVEGVSAIDGFEPTGANGSPTRHATATVSGVAVADGRLTIDATGGSNTKINFVEITGGEPDDEPPTAPTGLAATAGNGQVSLNWNDNPELDIAGYFVYRSTTLPVDTTTALNPTPIAASAYVDSGLANDTTYHYVVKAEDTSGNLSAASDPAVSATPVAADLEIDVNFQNAAAAVPAGYVRDFGEGYGARTLADQGTGLTYGWVVPGTSTPRDLSVGGTTPGNGRDRNAAGVTDQRYDTLMHMQADDVGGGTGFNGTQLPGSWEIALPNGTYAVTVAAGDPNVNTDPEAHTINVEGNTAIDAYVPTGAVGAATRSTTATVVVRVQDGRLTLDAEGGTNTKIHFVDISSDDAAASRPAVTGITPAAGTINVNRDSGIAATVSLPNAGDGVDGSTLTPASVQLLRASDLAPVAANLNTSGGGDVIVIQPAALLQENTKYVIEITDGVQDLSGASFLPFTSTFTTGTGGGPVGGGPVEFEKVALSATGKSFTSVEVGPDGKLYASTIEGEIMRYTIGADGTLSAPQTITSLQAANGGAQRMLIGIEFDPAATSANPILWVTHSAFAFNGGPDWAGKLTRMSGPNLETVQDYVVNLPRSIRDHLTNGLQFGPGGDIYFLQGSNSAMGAPDNAWGNRSEHLLNAAVLRFDPDAVTSPPLDVKTEDGGSYNPFGPGAPLTIFASGIRNAYDLWWHSNGSLYVPTNGSAAGGNTPGTPATLPAACQNRIDDAANGDYTGPQVPGITNVTATQNDFLFRTVQGGYYGHPNPSRCEWVLNGGNPTAGTDTAQVTQYPNGTQPDRNWRGAAYNFGNNKSPNGLIEYESNLFGGSLAGKLLVVRYSQNDDIIVLTPGAGGDITAAQTGLPGLTGFVDPLDLTEHLSTGNIYVAELGAQRITLLDAVSTGGGTPDVALSPDRLIYNDVSGGAASASQTITVENNGGEILTVSAASLTGTNQDQFQITSGPTLPAQVPAGGSIQFGVAFNPTSTGVKGAALQVTTDDPDSPLLDASLRGLGTLGIGGSNEPSLQWILDTYEHAIDVGDPDPTNNALPTTSPLGDEVIVQAFQKAGAGNVTIEPLAVFGPSGSNPVLTFGWYPAGNAAGTQQLFSVSNSPASNAQTLNVPVTGTTSFDPGAQAFGLYSTWPFFGDREVFQEDALNTFSGAIPHHVRVYELKDDVGAVVPDAYVVATEETTSGFDYQDVVAIVRNVEPAAPVGDAEISVENLDGVPFDDRLAFSRIGSLASPPTNGVHDVATVRVHNTGPDPLSITSLPITGPWQLAAPIALPATVPSGGQLDIAVEFIATSGAIHNGTLTIGSNDADEPSTVVELSGFWQSVSEGGQEPEVDEISSVFGYGTEIFGAGEQLNQNGFVTAVGDEVLSPYWRRADTTKTVTVRQLAAYHTQGSTATVFWHQLGSNTTSTIFTHAGIDGQSILPRLNGQLGQPAAGSFTPTSAVFGFKVDGEWSDPTKNNQTTDQSNGCPTPCGHHVRFWPVRDRQGALIPDTWLMGMDYSGINYDYNDNVYLITNIAPEDPALDPTSQAPVPGSPKLILEFDQAYPGTLVDGDTDTTGFTSTQPNENDTTAGSDSYDPSLLDVDTAEGTLAVSTTIGSNAGNDNTLTNGLRLAFDASLGEFVASVRLQGPLTELNSGSRQGGVMFGPNQENYAKVVAINKNGTPSIEFWVEQNGTGATIGTTPAIPSPGTLDSLDLFLFADPATGVIRAGYRSIGTAGDSGLVVLPTSTTLTGQTKGRFFDNQANAGIITMHKTSATPIVVTFDRFAVEAGDPTDGPDDREALHRLDVAGAGSYTDTQGNEWTPDSGLFSPPTAIAEGGSVQPQEIANTDDDVIYRTYRGNVGAVPIAQRVLTYNIPTYGLQSMDLRLHFAERASGNDLPGERLFDVEAEGDLLLDDFDIVAASGGQHTAIVVPIDGVDVNDGSLTLVFRAVADYPSIAGIEVLCPATCPEPDGTPAAAPTGLTATPSAPGVALDWANNAEPDLAGYNVYRASAPGGPFTKLNGSLLTASQYSDSGAPGGVTSYYEVTAVDTSGNESDPATANADAPVAEDAIRFNAGGTAQSVGGTDWDGCASIGACNGYVTGGFAYTQAGSPTIASVPAGMNQAIFQTEWTGGLTNGVPVGGTAFTFDVPVDNGSYLVRLHFAELNKNGAGLRVFDVNIEGGALELEDYDIWSEVGYQTATVEEFTTNVVDGDVTIQFVRQIENAKVSAIEIIPLPTSAIRFNAGGTAQSVGGTDWDGCASIGACNGYVTGGFAYTQAGSPTIASVPAGMNQAIFQTEWTGGLTNGVPVGGTAFTFDVPVDNGSYLVRLHFAELNKNGAGLRVFDVNIEGGALELEDYDIWSEVGYQTATVEEFTTNVVDGDVTIQFVRQIENAKVSAIEIIPLT